MAMAVAVIVNLLMVAVTVVFLLCIRFLNKK